MAYQTDLAVDCSEKLKNEKPGSELDGVTVNEEKKPFGIVTTVTIDNENGAKQMGKPIGKYITAEIPLSVLHGKDSETHAENFSQLLKPLIPDGNVLIAALGNDEITADALGSRCADYVFATRHIPEDLSNELGLDGLRQVSCIVPRVLGQTGLEAGESIMAIAKTVKPKCIVVIDSLASLSLSRLGSTVQINTAGLTPGSGVGNHRFEISERTMGVPVITIGIPTVAHISAIIDDMAQNGRINIENSEQQEFEKMFVTPKDINNIIKHGSKLIALALNLALQETLSTQEIISLVG